MKLMRGLMGVAAAALLMGSVSYADEMTDMRQALDSMKREMADMKAKFAEDMREVKDSAGGEAPTELTTMEGYKMTIGGEIITEYRFEHGATDVKSSTKKTQSAGFGLNAAHLFFDVKTSDTTNVHLKLNLDNGGTTNSDIVEEFYYDWKKLLDGNLGIRVGKHEVAYGKPDATVGDSDASVHGGNTHMINGTGLHAVGEIDNTLGANVNYAFRDIAKIDFTLFSNKNATADGENKLTGDTGINSFASQVTLTPIEKLKVVAGHAHLTNENGDAYDFAAGGTHHGYYSSSDGYYNNHLTNAIDEISIGATYDINDKLGVFAQYVHTWNAGYVDEATVNAMNIGATYALTDKLVLGAMFDVERVNPVGYEVTMYSDTDALTSYQAAVDEENYYRAMFSAVYTFDNGVFVGLEYSHEWYDAEFARTEGQLVNSTDLTDVSAGSKGSNQADRFVLWTGVTF